MKRFLSLVLALLLLLPLWGNGPGASASGHGASFAELAAEMVFGSWEESWFSVISLTVDSGEMTVDGETVEVAAPVIEDGDVALPVLAIAEAAGADIHINPQTGQITVAGEDEELIVYEAAAPASGRSRRHLQIGGNGEVTETLPDGSRRVRTPRANPRQLEQALDLDIKVDGGDIFIFSRFQTKQLVVYMKPGQSLTNNRGASRSITDGDGLYLLQYDSVRRAKQAMSALERNPGVESVSPNTVVRSAGLSWGTDRIAAEQMTARLAEENKTGREVVVAVADTGVDAGHPHLQGRLKPGFNFVSTKTSPIDRNGHGTHVSGTVADCTPPNVKIMPIKVLNDFGFGTELTIALGIRYAADNGADVINLSLSGIEEMKFDHAPCPVKKAVDIAVQKGTVVVAAAGNSEYLTDHFCPARHDNVISVAATDEDDIPAWFSNYGESVDLAAPGVNIVSAVPGGQYMEASGTSMAAPHAAAGVALLMLDGRANGAAAAKSALTAAVSVPDGWSDQHGWYYGGSEPYGRGVLDFRGLLGVTEVPDTGPAFLDGGGMELDYGLLGRKKIPLPVTVRPANANDKAFTVTSGDPDVAVWEDGFLLIKGVGETTLTALSAGGLTADFTVKVNPSNAWIDYAAPAFGGGSGTPADPYLILSPEHLAKLAYDLRAGTNAYRDTHFRLENDLDLSGKSWGPIGYTYVKEDIGGYGAGEFRGHFDGNHKVVRNIHIPESLRVMEAGLFSRITGGSVKNLGIERADIHSVPWDIYRPPWDTNKAGVLAAYAINAAVSGCYASAVTPPGRGRYNAAGALIHTLLASEIRDCFSDGVPLFLTATGGVVANSYTPSSFLGDLVSGGRLVNSFSTFFVNNNGGGFIGQMRDGAIENCFYYTDDPDYSHAHQTRDGAWINVGGRPMSFFRDAETYTQYGASYYGYWNEEYPWDFVSVWTMDSERNRGLPYLKGFAEAPALEDIPPDIPDMWVSEDLVYAAAPFEHYYIDLSFEDAFLGLGTDLDFYKSPSSSPGFSVDGGRSWRLGMVSSNNLPKILNKGGVIHVTNNFDRRTKRPAPGADIVIFPPIEKRPSMPLKLVPNYLIKADPDGRTLGGWVLTERNGTAMVTEGYEIAWAPYKGRAKNQPAPLEWGRTPWYALNELKTEDGEIVSDYIEEGIPVLPHGVDKEAWLLRKPPQIGEKIYPASKFFRVQPKNAGRPLRIKANYKTESVKLRADAQIYGGFYSELFFSDRPAAVPANQFTTGALFKAAGSDTVGLSAILDQTRTDEGAPVTRAVCIWSSATSKKPASDVQEYILAIRAKLPEQSIEAVNGKVSLPKDFEVFSNNKWGALPSVSQTTVIAGGIRLKATARANGYDDSEQLAASHSQSLTIEVGALPSGRNAVLRLFIG
ncbi:MAG: S8 family serine peptidase [Oscillospiraceae bacterium]|nr:S8 family serine peptidase [Oscillospiraceae bacterium]